MRILIVSDLHGNLEALESLPSDYDEMWVLGDLVNYGPNPAEVIEFVRGRAALVIRGNHDHALGYGVDPQCSARFRRMAEETARFTATAISDGQRQFLRSLPLRAERQVDGTRFLLCHATPGNALHEYRGPESELWQVEAERVSADVLLVGHTHLPFRLALGRLTVVNPGSVGQPKHGMPRACYAMWDSGGMKLESREYAVEETAAKVRALLVSKEVIGELEVVLRTGTTAALTRAPDKTPPPRSG